MNQSLGEGATSLLKGSLRNKIIAWSFVPTAIILVTVTLVSLYAYQRVTESLVIERDRELTRLSARLLAAELAAYTDPLADQFAAIFDGVIFERVPALDFAGFRLLGLCVSSGEYLLIVEKMKKPCYSTFQLERPFSKLMASQNYLEEE